MTTAIHRPVARGVLALMLCWATGAVAASPDEAEVTVQTASIVATTLCARLTVYGTLEPAPAEDAEPAAIAVLAAAENAWIESVEVCEGEWIGCGRRLVRLDARVAEAAVARARAELAAASAALERQRRLLEHDATSQRDLLEAEERHAIAVQTVAGAEASRSRCDLVSPIAGVAERVWARAGELAIAGQPLVRILSPERLVFAAAAPAAVANRLRAGQIALVEASGIAVTGVVQSVAHEASPGTDMVGVRIRLPRGTSLRAGQFARARVVVEEHVGCLAVPLASVYTDHGGVSEIRLVDGNRARRIQVRRGLQDTGLVEVAAEGLKPGATVVTVGAYALPDGARVRVVSR
ncbi:MAG: efflux RND transporter periplasmic adaptor subunit [Kiritimatiellae bacterium]|nr:efflux RND transporter periplasmic adaptor subunit [Kiritimatiellia bacterium]